jgi:hypothetical protein
MKRLALLTCSLLTLTAGCFVDPTPGDEDQPGDGTDDPVDPPAPPAVEPTARGAYHVRSVFDITAAAVLPEPAYQVVETLHNFSTAPAHTLFDLAEAAGVPAVGTLRDALPDSLESRLEGWIDDQIEGVTVNGVPVTQVAGELAAVAQVALTQFAIDSSLDVRADGRATHRLTQLDFTPAGLDARAPLGDLPLAVIAAETSATCKAGALALGDQRFGLPYGQLAWQALESAITAQYGADIRALLGSAVNCPAVATTISNKCVFGVCVGHRAELLEVCERGLDEVVDVARGKMTALRFDAIRLEAGAATLADLAADGTAARLTGGVWTAQIDASQGLRPVPATFTAAR